MNKIFSLLVGSLLFIAPQTQAKWVLSDPKVFDLKMSSDIFSEYKYEIKKNVKVDPAFIKEKLNGDFHKAEEILEKLETEKCHIQGLAIDDDDIVISCCFYPVKYKVVRSYASASLLLRADLQDVLDEKNIGEIEWTIKDVTEYVPETTANGDEVTRVLGHPGGVAIDPTTGQGVLALAVYDKMAKGRFLSFDPHSLKIKKQSVLVNEHLSIAGPILGKFWVGTIWGSEKFVYVDQNPKKGMVKFESAEKPFFDYQDCEVWDQRTLICGGNYSFTEKEKIDGKDVEWKNNEGKIFMLEFEGINMETLKLAKRTPVLLETEQGESEILGKRRYRYVEGIGDVEQITNTYGTYTTNLSLPHEGLALSADGQHIFFVPDDIPGGKLIRYTLIEK